MIRKILLVGENSEAHNHLVRSLAAHGVQVVPQPTLRAAASLLGGPEKAASVLVLDVQLLSQSDADLLADLSDQHPQVQIMLFASRACRQEALSRLQTCNEIKVSSVPLEDPAACASIIHAITERVASGSP